VTTRRTISTTYDVGRQLPPVTAWGSLYGTPIETQSLSLVWGAADHRPERVPSVLVFRLSTVAFEQQRQDYLDALGWVSGLMLATTPAQLIGPTPCEEFDVRLLMGHLVGTARRSVETAERSSTRDTPHVVTSVPDDDLAAAYADLASQVRRAWSLLHGTDRVTAPWGSCTALEAVRGFTVETITHGWDLAVAIGQPSDVLDVAAQRCLFFTADLIPARLRGVMYDEPVETSAAASATERLAGALGRHTSTETAG